MLELWDTKTDPRKIEREVWTVAVGTEAYYLVSNMGRVARIVDAPGRHKLGPEGYRIRALSEHKKGYLQVGLHVKGKRRSVLVHRLVLESFDGPPPEDEYGEFECHHDNADQKDNRLVNLMWLTAQENREEQWHRYITKGEVTY